MKSFTQTQYLSCAVAVTAGALIGWKTASPLDAEKTIIAEPGRHTAGERNRDRVRTAYREAAQKMKAVRGGATQEERIRAAISLAMSLPPSEFAAWAAGDRFDFRAGSELHIFRMILFERWIAEDPDSLIVFSAGNYNGQEARALDLLSKDDPERVIDYFRKNPDDTLELKKLLIIAKDDPALVISRLKEMSARGMTSNDANRSIEVFLSLTKKSPELLEAALAELSPILKKNAEIVLISERISGSFKEEVRVLWERPDGWEIFNDILGSDKELRSKLINEINNIPEEWRSALGKSPYNAVSRDSAKQWLDTDLIGAGFSEDQAKKIKVFAMRYLSEEDPETVIAQMDNLKLETYERSLLIDEVYSKLWNSPEKAESLIGMLASEEDKAEARKAMQEAEQTYQRYQTNTLSDWLQTLNDATDTSNASRRFTRDTSLWNSQQVSEFKQSFADLPDEKKQKIAKELAIGNGPILSNSEVKGHAVKYLVENSHEENDTRSYESPAFTASEFALRLASDDLSAATTWIDTLPQGTAKSWAMRNVAADMRQYDPAAVRQWISTLPKAEQEDLNKYLAEQN